MTVLNFRMGFTEESERVTVRVYPLASLVLWLILHFAWDYSALIRTIWWTYTGVLP